MRLVLYSLLYLFCRFENFPNISKKLKRKIPVSVGHQALWKVVSQMEGKIKPTSEESNSLRRRLCLRQVWHWSSEGPVQRKHLVWQGLHPRAFSSQYSEGAHSLWGTQSPWLFILRPSLHVLQVPNDEQVSQDLWQSVGGVGTAGREWERARVPL